MFNQQPDNMLTPLPQLRIALNARCGHACFFCRPSGEGAPTQAIAQLHPDAAVRIASSFYRHGIRTIKLTGGDPALYVALEEVVTRLRREVGFEEVEIISRHPIIGERADALVEAGVTQFNLSLDTLNPGLHRELVGQDDHAELLAALDRCVSTGVACKINVVVMRSVNDTEVDAIIRHCEAAGVQIVKLLDVIKDMGDGAESYSRRLLAKRGMTLRDLYMPLDDYVERYRQGRTLSRATQGDLGHPMAQISLPSGMKLLIKDSQAGAWYGEECKSCRFFPCHDALMAVRVTADQRLQKCLLKTDDLVGLRDDDSTEEIDRQVAGALASYAGANFFPGCISAIALTPCAPAATALLART